MTTENARELAQRHAAEAERFVAEAHELMSKRGRKLGAQQEHELTLAGVHASLALYYQRETS